MSSAQTSVGNSKVTSSECPFCNFRDLAIIFESEFFRAAYNKFPIVTGHSLLAPKRHIESFLELSTSESEELFYVSKRIISAVLRVFDTDSFDFALQEGVPAGGTIAHLHFHVIPRRVGDLGCPDDWYPELLKQYIHPSNRERVALSADEMLREARRIGEVVRNNQIDE